MSKIIGLEYIMLISKDNSLINTIENNIQNLKLLLLKNEDTELSGLINFYEKGLIRINELSGKIPEGLAKVEDAYGDAWWSYVSGMRAAILLAMGDMEKRINTYFIVIALFIFVIGVLFTYSIVKSINYGVKENYVVIESVANGNLNIQIKENILNRLYID